MPVYVLFGYDSQSFLFFFIIIHNDFTLHQKAVLFYYLRVCVPMHNRISIFWFFKKNFQTHFLSPYNSFRIQGDHDAHDSTNEKVLIELIASQTVLIDFYAYYFMIEGKAFIPPDCRVIDSCDGAVNNRC